MLLPGGLTGWQSWLPLVPALAELRRVVRVQPIVNAEGIAGRVGDGSYDATIERESLLLTLASAGVDKMHLVGWSNGGRMALDLTLAQPERVRTPTMIEPAAWWLAPDSDESARRFADFVGRCARCELLDDAVVEEFLLTAGFAEGVDFRQLPQWDFWSKRAKADSPSCRAAAGRPHNGTCRCGGRGQFVAFECILSSVSSYRTLVQVHRSVPEALAWMDAALRGIEPADLISITQSTTSDSGPGYTRWEMTTMLVIKRNEDAAAAPGAVAAFDVILKDAGDKKIQVITIIREWTGWGLAEAKELVDTAPKAIAYGLGEDLAKRLEAQLTEVGATVELHDR